MTQNSLKISQLASIIKLCKYSYCLESADEIYEVFNNKRNGCTLGRFGAHGE